MRVCRNTIELFKHGSGIYRVEAKNIKLDNNITRGKDRKLKKQRAFKIVRQSFLTLKVTNTWNSLPQEMVAAPSLNVFKAILEKYWVKLQKLNKTDGKCIDGLNLPAGF